MTDQIYAFLHSVKMMIQRGSRSMIIMRKKEEKKKKSEFIEAVERSVEK